MIRSVRDRVGGARAVGDHNAPDPPRSRPLHGHQGDAVPDLGASLAGGVDEDPINHCPPRRIEGVDAVLMLDVDCDFFVAVAEYRAPYRRCAGGNDAVEEAPPVQLKDAATHQGVGRQRVAAVWLTIDKKDALPAAGKQHRRRSTGRSRTDNDHVVKWPKSTEDRHCAGSPMRLRALQPAFRKTTMLPERSTPSAPTPSMKFELRRRVVRLEAPLAMTTVRQRQPRRSVTTR